MCNDAIRIATQARPENRFRLVKLAYPQLKEYRLHSHYILSACEVAYSVYKNRKRQRIPYVKRAFLKLDNWSYQLNHLLLRIPTTPRHFIFIVLQGSDFHLSLVDDPDLRKGAVTITDRSVSITFSKNVRLTEPKGFIGADLNERNITVSATNGYQNRFEGLGEVVELKERYRDIRTKISKNTWRDRRISRKLLAKYGRRETNRTSQELHKITKQMVDFAAERIFGIKMENLTGIRKLFRRVRGQSPSFRGRMNTWVFGETRRQVEYKSKWVGVPTYFVNPRDTSRNCPDCGSRVAPLHGRRLLCALCDNVWDRDDLASKNIMACAVPQARPSRRSCEQERGGDGSNPSSRWREVGLRGSSWPKRLTEPPNLFT